MDASERLRRLLQEEASRGFDLARGPLFRAQLYRLAPDIHVLLLAMHHIVSDGWSLGILNRELGELYGACRGETPTLPVLRVQYRDFARWQRGWLQGEALEGLLSHWRGRLAGAPQVLELPTDRPRPAVESHRGASYSFRLPLELVASTARAGAARGGHAVHDAALWLHAAALALQRPARPSCRHAGRQPQPRRDRGPGRLFCQHAGAARRSLR